MMEMVHIEARDRFRAAIDRRLEHQLVPRIDELRPPEIWKDARTPRRYIFSAQRITDEPGEALGGGRDHSAAGPSSPAWAAKIEV